MRKAAQSSIIECMTTVLKPLRFHPPCLLSGEEFIMDTFEEKKRQFLKLLYEKTKGQEYVLENIWKLGEELGWNRDDTESVVQELDSVNLLRYEQREQQASITPSGRTQVRQA
jgi:hypothetical protein